MINTIVDKVFVITTLNSNRVDYIRNHLNETGINFDFFVSPETKIITDSIIVQDGGDVYDKHHKASISLISSFVSIVEISKISNFEKICIIEDDCYFDTGWKDSLTHFYNNLPNDWDLINLGYHPLHDSDSIKEKINDFVYKPLNYHHTTHCMIVKNTCFDEYINMNNKFKYTIPVDYVFNEIYKNSSYKSFYPVEKFVYQLSVRKNTYNVPNINLRFNSLVIK